MADELKDTVMSQNFIHDFIDEDLAPGGQYEGMQYTPASHLSPTAICTSAMPRRSSLTLALRPNIMVSAICAWTTPTPPRRMWSS